MDHAAAIATLTDATTTSQLAAAVAAFTDLRQDAEPGTAPGVPDDAPDGQYFNGFHLFTKTSNQLHATEVRSLPRHTLDLFAQLDQERRNEREEEQLVAEVRRGRGRPQIGRAISVRLPDWRITALDRDAQAAGVDRPELIRALIGAAYATLRTAGAAGTPGRAEALRALVRGDAPTVAEQVLSAEAVYHVEILHPESTAWNHIHGLDWETTDSYPDAWIYAGDVVRDHPGSRVRLVETYPGRGPTYLPLPEVI